MTGQLRLTEGEFGFSHQFIFGTSDDLSWASVVNLIIQDTEGLDKLNITTNLTISPNNKITWNVQSGETNFNGNYDGIFLLTDGGTRQEEIHFKVKLNPTKA